MLVKNISVVGVYWGSYAQNNPSVLMKSLVQLTQWLKEGQLRPHVSAVYSLDEATMLLAPPAGNRWAKWCSP